MYKVIKKHLILRSPEAGDVNSLLAVKNNREAAKTLAGNNLGYERSDIEKWIDYHLSNQSNEICVIEYEGLVIGHVGFYNLDTKLKCAEFGILIGLPAYWGRGLGKLVTNEFINYGFDILGLSRITLEVLEENVKAIAIYEKLGFRFSDDGYKTVSKDGVQKKIVQMYLSRNQFNNV